jgi:hypothetical protein
MTRSYRVGYLDDADQELSTIRCIIAANSVWLQRNLSGLLPVGNHNACPSRSRPM